MLGQPPRLEVVRVHNDRFGRLIKILWVLRIEVRRGEDVARQRPPALLLPPGPVVSIVAHNLPSDPELRAQAEGDLPYMLAAHEDPKVRVPRAGDDLGVPGVAEQLDPLRVSGGPGHHCDR